MDDFFLGPKMAFAVQADEIRSATPGVEEAVLPAAKAMIPVTYYEQEMVQATTMLNTFRGITSVTIPCTIPAEAADVYGCELQVMRQGEVMFVMYDAVTHARLFVQCLRAGTSPQVTDVRNISHVMETLRDRGTI